jgi:hypothetical protein
VTIQMQPVRISDLPHMSVKTAEDILAGKSTCCLDCHESQGYCGMCEDLPCCDCSHKPVCNSCADERAMDDYFVNGS